MKLIKSMKSRFQEIFVFFFKKRKYVWQSIVGSVTSVLLKILGKIDSAKKIFAVNIILWRLIYGLL